MRIFVTGATGFVGSAIVEALISAGHSVLGLARSEKSAEAARSAGADVLFGNLEDVACLQKGTQEADAVIHTAFIHDFTRFDKSVAVDKAAIEAMGAVLKGTGKPMLVTSGMAGLQPGNGKYITEEDSAPVFPRASEATALALADSDVNCSVVRLPPSVHDINDHGFIPFIINIAREKGVSAYIGDGSNRWPAVHRRDAAMVYRLAIEKGIGGMCYHCIGDAGIPTKDIAAAIGAGLNLPVVGITPEDAESHFGWMARFFMMDAPSACEKTSALLGWQPTHTGLLEDMAAHYFG